jgi:hypothetical protein
LGPERALGFLDVELPFRAVIAAPLPADMTMTIAIAGLPAPGRRTRTVDRRAVSF